MKRDRIPKRPKTSLLKINGEQKVLSLESRKEGYYRKNSVCGKFIGTSRSACSIGGRANTKCKDSSQRGADWRANKKTEIESKTREQTGEKRSHQRLGSNIVINHSR